MKLRKSLGYTLKAYMTYVDMDGPIKVKPR